MARNKKSKGKGKAPGTGESSVSAQPYIPKIEPQLACLTRVITTNYTFRCLIDNGDVFLSDNYKDCPIIKECFGTSYAELLNDLQYREAGERYSQYPDLEDAGYGLLGTMDSPMKDGRKGSAMIQALRPYLLLDRWITVARKSPVDGSHRPVLGPNDLPRYKNKSSKNAKADVGEEKGSVFKYRTAMHNSHSVTLKMLNPAPPPKETQSCGSQATVLPVTHEHALTRLIRYGVNSKRHHRIGVAQYRLATMAVVVNFFTQRALSNADVEGKAEELWAPHIDRQEFEAVEEWKAMLKDGLKWLNMAVVTTLKDALAFSFSSAPDSAPFMLEAGMRHRQGAQDPGFVQLEKSLWELMFDLALLKTERTLSQHLSNIGEIAGAERPAEHSLSIVLFTAPPVGSLSSKRQRDSVAPEETSRPGKKARREEGDGDEMDVDNAVDPKDPHDSQASQSTHQPQTSAEGSLDGSPAVPADVNLPLARRSSSASRPQTLLALSPPPPGQNGNDHPETTQTPSPDLAERIPSVPSNDNEQNTTQRLPSPGHDVFSSPPDDDDEEVVDKQGHSTHTSSGSRPPDNEHLHSTAQKTAPPLSPLSSIASNDEDLRTVTHGPQSSPDILPQPNPTRDLNPSGVHQTDEVSSSNGDGKGVAALKGKQTSFAEEESEKSPGSRYPKRDRNPTKTSGIPINLPSKPKRRPRRKPVQTPQTQRETVSPTKVKEEGSDHYDRILFISNNVGYKFIDTKPEVIDVDALYEGFSPKHRRLMKKTDAAAIRLKKKAQTEVTDEAPNESSGLPVLKSVPAPSNRMTVNMVVDGQPLAIHTWYQEDFNQLTAFKKRFKERTTRSEDLVARLKSDDFKELPKEDIETLIAKKHLLVTGCDSVAAVADMERRLMMKRVIQIQDLYFRNKDNIASHCTGTLQGMKEIIKSEMADDKQRPLNALDLPCGQVPIDLPRLGDISFRDAVWSFLKHIDRPLYQESIPMDDFRWALYSSRNAYSTPHVDANGLCTVIAPVDCTKLWIVGRPLKETLLDSRALRSFRMYDVDLKDYEWIPLLLKPGDVFYMKPGTVHAVVTIEPGFTIGEHYYTMANLEDSLASIFHLSAANSVLTNASHNIAVMKTLIRLLRCWRQSLSLGADEVGVPKLDFSKTSSIRCLVMVATYLHVFPYVEDLERGLSPSDVEQLERATEDYHFLYNSLVQHFDVDDMYFEDYEFPDPETAGGEDEKGWEEEVYDVVCRNGQMWLVAHLVEFFANARNLVDAEEMEKLDEHAARLQELIPKLLEKAGLSQDWFDSLHGWIKSHFDASRLYDWLDWKLITILPRASLQEEHESDEESPESVEQETESEEEEGT